MELPLRLQYDSVRPTMHPTKLNLAPLVLAFCIASHIALASRVNAQFHPSHLQYLSRSAAQLGQSFDLSVHGERLEQVTELRFSNPEIRATAKPQAPLPFSDLPRTVDGHFTVQIPDSVAPGRYEVRAVGRHGTTNPRAFLVTARPSQADSPISHDRNAPTALIKDQFVHANCLAKQSDWYSFDLVDGERCTIELFAQTLDSSLIAKMELFDSQGRMVRSSRGSDVLDPALDMEGLGAGSYVLAVRDFLYRGGPEFHYQILRRDIESDEVVIGSEDRAEGQLPRHWLTCAAPLAGIHELSPEPADDTDQSVSLAPPTEVTRWFSDGPRDHRYEFPAQQGQSLAIDVISQRLAEPTDPRLIVERIETQVSGEPKLHHVAHYDDSPNLTDGIVSMLSKDPVAMFTAPEDATYRLLIRDLDIGTSLRQRQMYRLRIGPPNPGFDLVAYRVYPSNDANAARPFASKLFRGGAEMVRVFAMRRDGWTGAIKVSVEGLPSGVTCNDAFIAANQDRTQLTLVADEQATGHSDSIRVVGQSVEGQITQEAVPVSIAIARGHGRGATGNRVTTSLPVHVSEQDLSPLSLSLGDDQIAEVKVGETLALPVRMVRRDGGQAASVVRPVDLPPGIAVAEITIAADASAGTVELKPNPSTIPGTYSIWLQAETKIKVRPDPQSLERHQAYRTTLQSLHDDPAQAENLEAIKAAIAEADKQIEAAKALANEQELTVFIPTNHATIRVVQP